MQEKLFSLIEKLENTRSLTIDEYEFLIKNRDESCMKVLREKADSIRKSIYGKNIYIRGLIEISNNCKNDCYYCGIRRSNNKIKRYRLSPEEIIACTDSGYQMGFRTFVLQGGEDSYFSDQILCPLIKEIKTRHPDCAVTLSLGERSFESYAELKKAGADRYLLREETYDYSHYRKLHPESMDFENRIQCLKNLKDLDYDCGAGFMVGSPFQTERNIAQDLKFIEEIKPRMCGIGPFVPQSQTEFKNFPAGSADLTCFLISILRIMHPSLLIPATTSLGTVEKDGREKGILAGANVVMPNLSPAKAKENYRLYDNKLSSGAESAENLSLLEKKLNSIGFKIQISRGDYIKT